MSLPRVMLLLALAGPVACSDPGTGPGEPDEATSGTISPSQVSLKVGEIVVLRMNGISTKLTTVWASENPAIASVAVGGIVKGLQAGHTRITAQAGDLRASVEVTVVAPSGDQFPNPKPRRPPLS